MVLPPERLTAHVAGVGPLVGVCPLVDEEVVGLGELPVTELADKLFAGAAGPGGGGLEEAVPHLGRHHGAEGVGGRDVQVGEGLGGHPGLKVGVAAV